MSDDRPLQIGEILHGLPLAIGFLHLVFAQKAAAGRIGRPDRILALGLADRQESHRGRITPDALAGCLDAGMHRRQVVPEVVHGGGLRVLAMLVVGGLGVGGWEAGRKFVHGGTRGRKCPDQMGRQL